MVTVAHSVHSGSAIFNSLQCRQKAAGPWVTHYLLQHAQFGSQFHFEPSVSSFGVMEALCEPGHCPLSTAETELRQYTSNPTTLLPLPTGRACHGRGHFLIRRLRYV